MTQGIHICGAGLLTPVGNDLETFWDALMRGAGNFQPITSFDTAGIENPIAGICQDLPLTLLPERKLVKMMNRGDLVGLLAALSAWQQAGRSLPEIHSESWGAYAGSNYTRLGDVTPLFKPVRECVDAGMQNFDSSEFGARLQGMINPIMAIHVLHNNGLAQVTQALGLRGANCCYYDFDVSGVRAIFEACRRIRSGDIDGAVCGASYAPVDAFQFAQARSTGRQLNVSVEDSADAIEAWGDRRSGTILSEAGAYVVLDKLGSGPRVHGAAIRSSAALDERARADAIVRAIRAALMESGLRLNDLAFMIGQGSGCFVDDSVEIMALNKLASERSMPLPAMSLKPVVGETSEASAVLALIVAMQAMGKKILPPTKNFSKDRSKISKSLLVSGVAQSLGPGAALVYAFNKSGLAGAMVIRGDD